MTEKRGSWYLLTGLLIGLILGVGAGWVYGWFFRPLLETSPATLKAEYKDKYRILIASAFLADRDVVRARARLDLLKDPDVYQALAEQAQRSLNQNNSPSEAQALGLLALAIGQGVNPTHVASPTGVEAPAVTGSAPPETFTPVPNPSETATANPQLPTLTQSAPTGAVSLAVVATTPAPSAAIPSSTPPSGTPPTATPPMASGTPSATVTPGPTRIPTFTPGAPFVLDSRKLVCDQVLADPLIQVQAVDATGQPASGVEATVTWTGGEDHFFTGLKPELGVGYADFVMNPGTAYTLRVAEGGQPVSDLTAGECDKPGGGHAWGAWLLIFKR
jgi:hypothetical protein